MEDIRFSPSSWQRAGSSTIDLGPQVGSELSQLATGTTDAALCGAASGLSTVDAAVAIALGAVSEVMQQVATSYSEAITAEGESMIVTGEQYQRTEESNTAASAQIHGGL